jgi:hypothetical protein
MFCLATRFSSAASSNLAKKSAHSRSLEPKRQHLDSDAVHWVAPVVATLFMERVTLYPRVHTSRNLPPTRFFGESFYNRPPPQFLL